MSKSFKRFAFVAIVLVFVSAVALTAAVPAKAQGTGKKVTCDSSTIMLYYVATGLGFHSTTIDINKFELGQFAPFFSKMQTAMGAAGQGGQTSAGQAGQTGATGQHTTTGQAGQTGQTGQAGQSGAAGQTGQAGQTGAAGQTGQAGQTGAAGQHANPTATQKPTGGQTSAGQAGQAGQGASTVTLKPATIANEDPMCTQLRTEVENWLFAELQAGRLGMERFNNTGAMGATGGANTQGQAGQSGQTGAAGQSGAAGQHTATPMAGQHANPTATPKK